MLPTGKRWLVIAASSPAAATAFARAAGVEPVLVLDGAGLIERWHRLGAIVRDRGIDAVLLHSVAWRREIYPRVFEAALALVPVRLRYLADEETGQVAPVTRLGAVGRGARMPVDMLVGAALVGGRLTRLPHARWRPVPARRAPGWAGHPGATTSAAPRGLGRPGDRPSAVAGGAGLSQRPRDHLRRAAHAGRAAPGRAPAANRRLPAPLGLPDRRGGRRRSARTAAGPGVERLSGLGPRPLGTAAAARGRVHAAGRVAGAADRRGRRPRRRRLGAGGRDGPPGGSHARSGRRRPQRRRRAGGPAGPGR